MKAQPVTDEQWDEVWDEQINGPRYCPDCERPLTVEERGTIVHIIHGPVTFTIWRRCECETKETAAKV